MIALVVSDIDGQQEGGTFEKNGRVPTIPVASNDIDKGGGTH